MEANVLSRLRAATRDAHERLETRLDILSRIESRDGRRALVERFHGWHLGLESALEPLLAETPGLDYAARRRSQVLEADLEALGSPGGQACPIASPPNAQEALGMLYVAEGSTLGGRVIRRHAAARGLDAAGLNFLDPYGDDVGPRWKAFLAVLDRECASDDDEAMEAAVRGGVTGFLQAEAWLCDPEPAV